MSEEAIYKLHRYPSGELEEFEYVQELIRCKECRWAKANGTYQWCGRLDSTAQITADDFCSYGVRKGADDE